MCNSACIEFGERQLSEKQVKGLRVLEVGACDFNGSLRKYVEMLKPARYIGIDLVSGKGVDFVCSVEMIVFGFGRGNIDLVICTEMLEHVKDWRLAVTNLKTVCSLGGTILITTRSIGFPKHDFPSDYWRFEIEDMKHIFSDCEDVIVERDPEMPGVFVRATRTEKLLDLKDYEVYAI